MTELAVVRNLPSGVLWPPTPGHPKLEPAATVVSIHSGVQDASDLELVLVGYDRLVEVGRLP